MSAVSEPSYGVPIDDLANLVPIFNWCFFDQEAEFVASFN